MAHIDEALVKNTAANTDDYAQNDSQPHVTQGERRQAAEMKDRFPAKDEAAGHGRYQSRCHGRCQDDAGKITVQLFQGENRPGQGRIKGRCQAGTGTGCDQIAFFHARPPQGPAHTLRRHGTELDRRAFAA